MNLFDLTEGNYRVLRAVSYPEFPDSQIIFDAQVEASNDTEWVTQINVFGTYTGPTDVVANHDYQVSWSCDGSRLRESGSAVLELSSGKQIRQTWTSFIVPGTKSGETPPAFSRFPACGETITAQVTPFTVSGNSMSYDWVGTVSRQDE